jgi:hypothetical protein
MKERVDPETSNDFKRILTLTACLALLLAVLVVGFYYGCAKSSRPERPTPPPPPSGMRAGNHKIIAVMRLPKSRLHSANLKALC